MAASFVVDDTIMEQAEPKVREEVYEKLWTIPDWDKLRRSLESLEAQTLEFNTGMSSGVETKWTVGFKSSPRSSNVCVYWKLNEVKGFPDDKVQASAISKPLYGDTTDGPSYRWTGVMNLGQVVKTKSALDLSSDGWGPWMTPRGELVFKLTLKIVEPDVPSEETLKMELFHNASFAQVRANLGSLLGDAATADLKIMTSDGKELLAHKAILKAQCSVFESMFRSDFAEGQSGIVKLDDLTAKTMGIFLHLFYTGELLPSWKDDDTVVEFTYAVGKYQLANVLKLLDEVLGSRERKGDTFHTDIKLLDLAQKLDLKTAEKELLARIKKAVNDVNSGAEFFQLYGNGME